MKFNLTFLRNLLAFFRNFDDVSEVLEADTRAIEREGRFADK